jgi:hypothetical protein
MGNANITSKESKVPEKSSGGDEDPAVRVRDFIGLATGVAGTVAAFLVGFGILPNVSLSEQSLNFFAAIGLSGAIIAGIGAWRSVRRFVVMWAFIGVVVICLAALAVVAQRQTASQSATSTNRDLSTNSPRASAVPVAPPSRVAATTSAGAAAGSPDPGNSPANSSGQTVEYSGQYFSIHGGDCSDTSNYPSVLFTGQEPHVTDADENTGGIGPFNVAAWDIYLDCLNSKISFNGPAAILQGKPSPGACEMQINRDPLPGEYAFSQLSPGMQFCLDGADGNNLVYVRLLSASDTSYTTTWVATAWSIPASS